ncbi:glycosyltransferase family 4 protein [Aliiglaciecola sp. LCG003]|uniref:glycosyltransferase family 4 protein n=1 Tax=Aliiglaciecola sp. LCG003 TaxID=3053655 RepID=UPI002572352F|nr:glycosyltransferase family 4 protein [Aliiglaciecola sp. LCG003]WJG10402.1 glycosyltransferase family 4 protein [Aliiglaciecola sp. LCG003]
MTSPKNKKLIYILNSYSKNESSHFFHVLNLLEEMAKQGVDIVLLIEKASDIPTFIQKNISVTVLNKNGKIGRFIELFLKLKDLNAKGFNRSYVRIASTTAIVAAISNKMFGGRTYFWQSGTTLEWDLERPLNAKKIKWYLTSYLPSRLARYLVDYFVTGPESMVDYYANVAGVKRNKIRLLYNDIDIARFEVNAEKKQAMRSEFLLKNNLALDTKILLLVHRLSPVRKTTMYFPHCLNEMKLAGKMENVFVVIAGAGAELSSIKSLAKKFDVYQNCLFLGDVPNSVIQDLYKIGDVFIHPTYNEGFPRVVLEAMASSLPIVSTDAGGTNQLVGLLQTKFISDKDDVGAFIANLIHLISDEELGSAIARENRNHVERFATERIAGMYKEVIFE